MIISLTNLRGHTTAAAGRLVGNGCMQGNVRAPLKVNALFTTKKAKEERENKRPQSSNNDDPRPSSTSSPPISVDMFEKQGFRLGAFTKTNELFVGRMSMLGIASSILGELLTGKGALGQLGLETGLPVFELDWTIFVVVGFNLVAALWPTKDDDADSLDSARGARGKGIGNSNGQNSGATTTELQSPQLSASDFAKVFSIKSLLTKEREVLVGRVAQLGFAASLLGEGLTGKGILAQFNIETGLTVSDLKIFLLAFVILTLIASVWEDTEEGTPGGEEENKNK
ncbi:hypothetical protein Ndes2526B_g05800 [Nannochloris sp. 'desiccata']